ncbi:TPA: glycosyltransferase [Vibrio vulnificus]|nr:glycosyltransferase [Vibrio vulnificus]HAS6271525.1 glycosyltransferase [Vibrio vulnificus]HAS8124055.1 glycosyltransferase [Vibrio vulnificus]HAS8317389.1 glycosyltransferase [Vibrio vulnificus]HAS8414593.1 glycosyltransferase [Vibrio vulnificus]
MSNYMSKVCVLLAAYNGEKYIGEQVESILSQQGVDVDIYIRLDPSTDKSMEIIEKISKLNRNVHLLPVFFPSGGAGQNFLRLLLEVDISDYDYIAFSDQDDIWFSKKLLRAIDCLNSNNVDAYSGNVIAWWENGKQKLVNKSSPQRSYDYLFESAGPGCTFVFNKDLATELKFFLQSLDERIKNIWLHDWFFYAFARSRNFKWFIDAKPMMKYRQHDSNSVGANSGVTAFKMRVREVLSGEAFSKTLSQAEVLGLNYQKPIKFLLKKDFISEMRLVFLANQCRRKPVDKILFTFAILVYAFKRKLK